MRGRELDGRVVHNCLGCLEQRSSDSPEARISIVRNDPSSLQPQQTCIDDARLPRHRTTHLGSSVSALATWLIAFYWVRVAF